MQTSKPNGTQDEGQNRLGQDFPHRIYWVNSLPLVTQVLTVLISFFALLFVGAQALIYQKQLKAMNDAQGVMVEQTKIMKNSFLMNRAYVGVGTPIADIKAGRVTIVLENVGKLPADKLDVEFQETRRFGNDTPHASISHLTPGQQLIPGGKMPLVFSLDRYQPNEPENIKAKTETLFISGTITYDDGFGNPDATKFGFEYIPRPNEGWTPRSELIKKAN